MSAHTPGPWRAIKLQAPARIAIETMAMDYHIATVEGGGKRVDADATLIAAAPDLLAALKAITAAITDRGAMSDAAREAYITARAAIAGAAS